MNVMVEIANNESKKWLLGCACIFSEGLPKNTLRRYHTRTTAFRVAFLTKYGVEN